MDAKQCMFCNQVGATTTTNPGEKKMYKRFEKRNLRIHMKYTPIAEP